MLREDEIKEIQACLSHYDRRRAALPEALMIVQRSRRWVSTEAVYDIAAVINVTAEEVDRVATFYSLIYRRPVGRHVILICDSVSCWIMGYQPLREHLKGRLGIDLGQTTTDDRFTLLPTACLGDCDHAPVMMIDDDLHRDLTADKVDEILERYA
ncbi:MAG: NADH-quinone oxidoreductase subunit NuoE [Planctomycetaceae bacterium]|nr:NADH-quinone oxidoreductase subunit NuoE [Planctomycetaceae bacterium]